jgi:hypothetical protein
VSLPQPYSHSGGLGGGLALPFVGILGAFLGGVPYAYANVQDSIAGYFSLVLVAWLAACASLPVAFAAWLLRCRHQTYVKSVSAGTALAAIYLAWVFFVGGLRDRGLVPSFVDGVTHPLDLWQFAAGILDVGWYDIAGVKPAGVMLGTMWVFEAILVLVAGWVLATRFLRGRAHCDACGVWCVPGSDVLVPVTAGKTMKGLRAEGLASLAEVVIPDETTRTLQIYTWECPRCRDFAVFGANQLHRSKGRRSLASAIVEPVFPPSVRREADAADIERIRALLKSARAEQFAKVEIEPRPKKR